MSGTNNKAETETNGLKRSFEDEDDSSSMEDDSENEENEENEDEEMELGENDKEIQVDFEGQIPCLEDFAGIKSLLHQLFLKAHVNLSSLTDLILAQSFVGSVLKQCFDEDDDDASDDESALDEVFGITTVLNLTHHKEAECIKQLTKYIIGRTHKKASSLFENPANEVGLLINERFINIPPQVSVPLLENLNGEIENANKEGKPFKFTHLILISKMHESVVKGPAGKKKKAKDDSNILWVNAEEEPAVEFGEILGEYSVRNESDAAVGGTWDEEDEQFDPKRRITVLKFDQLPEIMNSIKSFLS
uniref:Protein BCCIP homolog n=1 Tax=Evadne anonyx TaxID=141404 RepID=A0A9N6WXQ3_9CRUS|nr:EOG090X0C3Y [Evadne anonyx]